MEVAELEKTTSSHEEHINHRGIKALPFIIGNEAFEKLGSIGTQSNLTVYLITVFNMKKITVALLLNIFQGTANVAPFLGALLSDSYFGRYKTLSFTSISSLLGMIVLTLTAAIPELHPPKCELKSSNSCIGATNWQLAFLLSAFGFITVGAAGIRPCSLAFGADQFNSNTQSGKKAIHTLFNWYYFTTTIAVMISATFIVYIQSNISWAIGMAIPASLVFFSCLLFFCGSKIYVKVPPEGSPLTSLVQVLVAANKKRALLLPQNPSLSLFNYIPPGSTNSTLHYTHQFSWLGKSAIITSEDDINPDGSAANKWKLCSIQQVEEAKCVLRVIPIWASGIIFSVAMSPQHTYVPFQALQSDRRLGNGNNSFQIPAASFVVFTMLSLTLWIPIYDRILIPTLKKLGYHNGITLLQRMGIGILLSIITMIISGLIEEKRRHIALTKLTLGSAEKGGDISAMSAFWLVPQLALTGLSEAFNVIGQIEFYYKEFPENMRSIGGSFLSLGIAGSNYLSGFLIATVHHMTLRSKGGNWLPEDLNKGKLDWFYYMIAGLGLVNFAYFLAFAKWYKYRGSN
ncbi:protein NRT1/ PTR FAMILY 2.11-like [Euphorbia lathyris]|uniref:protein NRT1/ PTR FAMILY 2.11-like n=1 Tax=Euphorbia lathyris TaxID=212925 RepID=UPI003313A29F